MDTRNDPFRIYKDGESKMVHGVDYGAWAAHGWSTEPPGAAPEPTAEPIAPAEAISPTEPSAYEARKAQLEALLKETNGWQHIKRIAGEYGITEKPEGGWDDAIPMILEAEGLKAE